MPNLGALKMAENGPKTAMEAVMPLLEGLEGRRGGFFHDTEGYPRDDWECRVGLLALCALALVNTSLLLLCKLRLYWQHI